MSEDSESIAERLMAKHAAAAAAAASTRSVEPEVSSLASSVISDVSTAATTHEEENSSANSTSTNSPPLSPAINANANVAVATSSPGKLDLKSMNAFPALGGGSSGSQSSAGAATTTSTPPPVSWGAKLSAGNSAAVPKFDPVSPRPSPVSDIPSINKVKRNFVSENFTLRADLQVPNARALLPAAVDKARRLSGASVDSSTNRMGHTSFVVKGKSEQVARAKRELFKELTPKIKKTIQIPADMRALVIGSKGATLRPIIEKSGTNIDIGNVHVEKTASLNADNEFGEEDPDEEETVDITIEGDEDGVKTASEEILAIVNSRVRQVVARIAVPDGRFVPFLKVVSKIPVKTLSNGNISIAGDQNTVATTKAELESYIQKDLADFGSMYVDGIPSSKYPLLNLDKVFTEKGVLATAHADVGRIELFGPTEKLSEVKKEMVSTANNNLMLVLDISKAHDKSEAHAKNLLAFFAAYKKTKPIEDTYNVILSAQGTTYSIVGTDKDKIKNAKNDLVALVNEYGPNRIRVLTDVSSFFSNRIKAIAASQNKVAVVQYPHDGGVVLVYEPKKSKNGDDDDDDDDDDFGPGSQEINQALDEVDREFDSIRDAEKLLSEQTFDVPKDEHKYILGPNGTTLRSIRGEAKDTVIELGTELAGGTDKVFIKGIKEDVERISKEISEIISESKDYQKLSNYTTEFKFPVAQISKLIGKQGANMTKLREEFGVKIDVDEEGNGVIKGFKKNAEEVKTRIIALGKKLEDETTLKMKVANEYHPILIGTGGKFVRRLKDKYNVHIQFPRQGDGTNQDEVLIRGPSRGVEKTREEFEELIKYEKDHSYTETAKVPENMLARIIGKQGENITQIKDSTETRIDVQDKNKSGDKVDVVVVGTKVGVKEAIEKINAIVSELSNIVDEELEVDPKYHGLLIGPGGSTQREIVDKAGGTDYRAIQIPPAGDESKTIKVRGNKKVVQKIIKQIKEIVDARERQITETVEIDPSRHGSIIGRGGLTRQDIEHQFDVTVDIPRAGADDQLIKVTGLDSEKVQQAIERIKEIAKPKPHIKLLVPKRYQEELANKGAFIKMLQSDYKVTVNVAGGSSGGSGGKDIIADAPEEAFGDKEEASSDGSVSYKFSIYPVEKKPELADSTVTWKIHGDEASCAAAKKLIEETLEAIKLHDHRGYIWFADSSSYKLIIGPQGRTINKIRKESGCTITIPAINSGKEIIGMLGSEQQLNKAKNLILNSVKGRTSNNRNGK